MIAAIAAIAISRIVAIVPMSSPALVAWLARARASSAIPPMPASTPSCCTAKKIIAAVYQCGVKG
ncbi:hypothetical protein [Pseudofrankia sp. BMG5.37]|uniref:hypothetical protein n=1 Tax=Pseudofrankia sp. BMG5.37 TaxID=3050035 RepID=UPI0028962602|nr:hypothetical protein [Pseudofrankia sp. BMG5.37]MDT3440738.1 hypothetical protein [Pseudofrankia sp. BMG5.37]